MNWSIDAEWYDANKYHPPVGEEVLCVVSSSGFGWNEAKQIFGGRPLVLMYIGSRDQFGWYVDGVYDKQRADVSYWTWLPKMPMVWVSGVGK